MRNSLKFILFLAILLTCLYFGFAFKEREYISNTFVTDKELDKAYMKHPFNKNTLLFLLNEKINKTPYPKGVEKVTVKLVNPRKIVFKITEMEKVSQIKDVDNKYVVFGKKGEILFISSKKQKNIPVIEGISVVEDRKVGEKVSTKGDYFFKKIYNLMDGLKKSKLKPNKIEMKNNALFLTFNNINVKMGQSYYGEKTLMLPGILEKLKGSSGTLDMSEAKKNPRFISFRSDKSDDETEEDENQLKDIEALR